MAKKKKPTAEEEAQRLARTFPALKSRPSVAAAAWNDPGIIDRSQPEPEPNDQPLSFPALRQRPSQAELDKATQAWLDQYRPTIYRGA
jgi:hypothetical protein